MFCGGFYYDLEAVCREYSFVVRVAGLFCWYLFTHLMKLPSIHRGLSSLQRQPVRLQPTCPWRSNSGGPASADHPAGKMHTNCMALCWSCLVTSYKLQPMADTFIWHCGFTHQQRSVLQAVSQAAKRIQTGHINNLQSVHINQEVNKDAQNIPVNK